MTMSINIPDTDNKHEDCGYITYTDHEKDIKENNDDDGMHT